MCQHGTTWKKSRSWLDKNLKFWRTRSRSSCWASSLLFSPALTFSLDANKVIKDECRKNSLKKQLPVTSPFLHQRSLQHQLVPELLPVALQKIPPVQRLQSRENSTKLARESRWSPLEVKELGAFGEKLGLESRILERMSELRLLFSLLLVLQPMEED